ncbi:MAG: hypothetical protein KDA60_00650, partial [Planctomycetales bacterium]|nr:hypothetical protein [Planctomycetales bacterium]
MHMSHEFRNQNVGRPKRLLRGVVPLAYSLVLFGSTTAGEPSRAPTAPLAPVVQRNDLSQLQLNAPETFNYLPFEDVSDDFIRLAQETGTLDRRVLAPSEGVHIPEDRPPLANNLPTPARNVPPKSASPSAAPIVEPRPTSAGRTVQPRPLSPASRTHERHRDPTRSFNPYEMHNQRSPARPPDTNPQTTPTTEVFAPTYAPGSDFYGPSGYAPDATRSRAGYSVQAVDEPPRYEPTPFESRPLPDDTIQQPPTVQPPRET